MPILPAPIKPGRPTKHRMQKFVLQKNMVHVRQQRNVAGTGNQQRTNQKTAQTKTVFVATCMEYWDIREYPYKLKKEQQ